MRKNIFICALAVIAFGLTSCKDNTDNMTEAEKRAELLVGAKNGWVLKTATSNPPYELSSGDKISDLFAGYLQDYDLDDIVIYKSNNDVAVSPGKVVPDNVADGYKEYTTMGKWKFLADDGVKLETHIPFMKFYGGEDPTFATVNVTTISEKELRFNYTFDENDGQDPAKAIRTYTFSLVFERK